MHIDNDLLALSNADPDCTGGLALSIPLHDESRPRNAEAWLGRIAETKAGKPTPRLLQLQILVFSAGQLS